MKTNKILCFILAAVMLLSVTVGCDRTNSKNKDNEPKATEYVITEAPAEATATETLPPEATFTPGVTEETNTPVVTGTPNTTAVPSVKATTVPTQKTPTPKPSSGYTITYDTNGLIARDYVSIKINDSQRLDMITPGYGVDESSFEFGLYAGKKVGLWGWYGTTKGKIEAFGYAIDGGPINYSSSYNIAVSQDVINHVNSKLGTSSYKGYYDINPVIPDAKSHKYEVFAKIGNENIHIWTVYGLAVGETEYIDPGKPTAKPTPTPDPGSQITFTDTFVNDGTSGQKQVNGHFTISYKTTSYVTIGNSIKLNASYSKNAGGTLPVTFTSQNTNIATCDASGNVKGISMGVATVRASVSNNDYIDFYVTVIPSNLSSKLMTVVKANNSNTYARKSLSIGYVYNRDIYGSISKILYNDELKIDTTYNAKSNTNTANGSMDKGRARSHPIEFITVHYTGNMDKGATAKNNADYFSWVSGLGIHYTTGNDGVFQVTSENYEVNQTGDRVIPSGVKWIATGVTAPTSGDKTPSISISSSGYFTINGKQTTYKTPSRAFSAMRHFSNSGYTGDSIVISGPTFTYSNGKTYPCITKLGIPWKIMNGQYYMLDTYWDERQETGGRICAYGGDFSSIGIESCVNIDSELWYTWNKTAQLVAKVMKENKLDINRVVGHNTWTAKNCPQPLLENNNELWKVFLEMCQAEYDKLVSGSKYSMSIIKGSEVVSSTKKTRSLTNEKGTYTVTQGAGVVVPDNKAHVVLYEVTVVTNGRTEKIKLASAVNPQ